MAQSTIRYIFFKDDLYTLAAICQAAPWRWWRWWRAARWRSWSPGWLAASMDSVVLTWMCFTFSMFLGRWSRWDSIPGSTDNEEKSGTEFLRWQDFKTCSCLTQILWQDLKLVFAGHKSAGSSCLKLPPLWSNKQLHAITVSIYFTPFITLKHSHLARRPLE